MSQHRDSVVADALRRLEVPDHAAGFWDALDASLAAEGSPEPAVAAAGAAPAPGTAPAHGAAPTVVDLAASPAAQRRLAARRRTPLLALAAAVAVVVALVVGAAVLRPGGDDESQLDTAVTTETTDPDAGPPDDDATTVPGPATTEPAPTTTTVPEEPAGGEPRSAAEAEAAAVEWIARLFDGDIDGAYDRLDDTSHAALSRAEFEELSSGLSEGAASFGQEGVERAVTALEGPAGSFHVVTFTGEVQREGTVETAAYPVVVTPTGVHFTLGGPRVDLEPEYARSSGSTLASPLELVLSPGADTWVWFDGGEALPFEAGAETSIDVEAAAGPGTHLVSVVAAEGELITARAYTVVVP